MSTDSLDDRLVEDLAEIFEDEGVVPLYQFSWLLRGYDLGLTDTEIESRSLRAYRTIVDQLQLRLFWADWPIEVESMESISESVALNFDLDSTAVGHGRLVVLAKS